MTLLVVFLVFAVALVGRAVVDRVRLRRSGYRAWRSVPRVAVDHRFVPEASASFRGAGANAVVMLSGPMVVLDLDAAWVHMRGTGGLIDVWVPRDRIAGIKPVRLTGSTAIRFLTEAGEYDGLLFLSFRAGALIQAFGDYGWPVTG